MGRTAAGRGWRGWKEGGNKGGVPRYEEEKGKVKLFRSHACFCCIFFSSLRGRWFVLIRSAVYGNSSRRASNPDEEGQSLDSGRVPVVIPSITPRTSGQKGQHGKQKNRARRTRGEGGGRTKTGIIPLRVSQSPVVRMSLSFIFRRHPVSNCSTAASTKIMMWLQPQQPWWAITVSQRVRIAHPWHLAAFPAAG